jgi:hypothetical protein
MVKLPALLMFACALASAYQEQPPPAKGSLAGIVTDLKTGAPLKKAIVTLIPTSVIAGLGSGGPSKSAESDQAGRFLFPALDAGAYRLSATRQGYLASMYGARKVGGMGTPVVVAEGQDVKDIAVSLTPQSVITGKVIDEDGDPVANLMVRAVRNIYRNGRRQWFPAAGANTNDIGEYRLANLEPGRYIIDTYSRPPANDVTRSPASEPQAEDAERVYASTYYPSTLSPSLAIPVTLTPGDDIRGIDVHLLKTRVYQVRGTVVGNPEPRAISVTLAPRNNELGTQYMGMTGGANSEFQVRYVLPGEYTVTAQARTGAQLWTASEPLIVTGTNVDGLRLTLSEAATIHGTVKVVDAAPPPQLKNVSIRLVTPLVTPGQVGNPGATSLVRDDMQFTLMNVPPLRQTVEVSGIPQSCYVQSTRYGGAEIPADGIELHAGGTIEITLSCQAAQLDAVATTQDDKVAPHAVFALVPKDGGPVIVRTANENGIYSFQGLKPGDYSLFAWEDTEEGAPLDPDFRKPFESQAKLISLDPAARANISLKTISQ